MPRERLYPVQNDRTVETTNLAIDTEPAEHLTSDTTPQAVIFGTVLTMGHLVARCLTHRLRTAVARPASNQVKLQYHQAHVIQDD